MNTNRDRAVQRRASDLMDAGMALYPALLQAQREIRGSLVITVEWFPDCVRLTQRDMPGRSVDIPAIEVGAVLAQIVAEIAGEAGTFWDMLAWLEANAKTRAVGEHNVSQRAGIQ